jgi:glycine betaine/proline transport system permease protein
VADNFPELIDTRGLRFAIDDGFSWIVTNYGDTFERLLMPLLRLLSGLEAFLQWLPWYVTIIAIGALTYSAARSLKAAAGAVAMLLFIGVLGLWNDAMATVALMLAATVVAVVVGIPLGIAMARSDWLRSMALPVLDMMQTLPIFVYLIPFVMLFGPGKIPAIARHHRLRHPAGDPPHRSRHAPGRQRSGRGDPSPSAPRRGSACSGCRSRSPCRPSWPASTRRR